MIAQHDSRSDNSLFPQTELPVARQYRHCGLLRHIGDDPDTGQYQSIPARTGLQHLIVDLKQSFGDGSTATVDLKTTTSLDERWRKKPSRNFNRRTNTAFEKRNSRACVGTAVPNPATTFCMKLAK